MVCKYRKSAGKRPSELVTFRCAYEVWHLYIFNAALYFFFCFYLETLIIQSIYHELSLFMCVCAYDMYILVCSVGKSIQILSLSLFTLHIPYSSKINVNTFYIRNMEAKKNKVYRVSLLLPSVHVQSGSGKTRAWLRTLAKSVNW